MRAMPQALGETVWMFRRRYVSAFVRSCRRAMTRGTRNVERATCATTMFASSERMQETTASVRSIPARRSTSRSRPMPHTRLQGNESPSASSAFWSWSTAVTENPCRASFHASPDPMKPMPTIMTFIISTFQMVYTLNSSASRRHAPARGGAAMPCESPRWR